eukprot:gene15607-18502_t
MTAGGMTFPLYWFSDDLATSLVFIPKARKTRASSEKFINPFSKDHNSIKDKRPPAGSYVFVKTYNESGFRVGYHRGTIMQISGHALLADQQPVLYAGEMEFDDEGRLILWTNFSGTYCPSRALAFQCGLPMDKFWYYCSPAEVGSWDNLDELMAQKLLIRTTDKCGNTEYCRRALTHEDSKYEKALEQLSACEQSIISEFPEFGALMKTVQGMREERVKGMAEFGYGVSLCPIEDGTQISKTQKLPAGRSHNNLTRLHANC